MDWGQIFIVDIMRSMQRKPRIESAGATCRVTSHGAKKKPVFRFDTPTASDGKV